MVVKVPADGGSSLRSGDNLGSGRSLRALHGDGGGAVNDLGDPDNLLVPVDLADNVAVGNILGAVEADVGVLNGDDLGSSGGGRGRGRDIGVLSDGGNGSSRRGLIDRSLLEDVAGCGSRDGDLGDLSGRKSRNRGVKNATIVVVRLLRGLGLLRLGAATVVLTFLEGDGDTTGKVKQRLQDILPGEFRGKLHRAGAGLRLADDVKQRAVLDATRLVGASVDSLLKEVFLPAHHEIGVVTETYTYRQ